MRCDAMRCTPERQRHGMWLSGSPAKFGQQSVPGKASATSAVDGVALSKFGTKLIKIDFELSDLRRNGVGCEGLGLLPLAAVAFLERRALGHSLANLVTMNA